MKRYLVLLLIAVMAITTFLSGCGTKAPSEVTPSVKEETPSVKTEEKTSEPVQSAETVKLEYWTWLANDDAVAAFNESHEGIEVEKVQMSHADINAKLLVALNAGTGAPNIYNTTHRYFTQFKDSEKMYDMTADVAGVIGGFPESLQALVSKGNVVYGLPGDVSPSVFWFRKDIFEKYNIQIETFDDVMAAGEKLKADGLYIMPIFNPAGTWGANALGMLLGSRGGNYFNEDGSVIKNNTDLETVLTWLDKMVENDYAESLTFFTPEFWGEFKSGNVVGWIMNVAEGANIKANCPELSGKWSVMATPRWADKNEAYSGFWGGTVLSVPDQNGHKAEATEFVKWLAGTVEGQVWAGKTWNAVPALTAAYDDPFFSAGDPFYSDACVYEVINPTKSFYYFDWAKTEAIIGEKLDLMFAGKATPVETARAIEDTIAAETGR